MRVKHQYIESDQRISPPTIANSCPRTCSAGPRKTAATLISPDIHEQIEARLAPFMWKTILDTKGCISASSFSKYPAHTASGSASLSAKCRQIDGDVTPDTLRHRLDEHRLGLPRPTHKLAVG